jgi:glycosyltransferase involved in cell wall biosynthesis
MVEELVAEPAWLRSRAGRLDAIHLHWPEKIWRNHVPAPLGALARSGIKGSWRLARAAPGLRKVAGLALLRRLLDEAKRLGLLVVWTAHNAEPHEGTDALDRAGYHLLAARADVIVCHSQAARAEFEARHRPTGRVVVMPIGNYEGVYPSPRPRDEVLGGLGLRPERPTVCCVGELRAYKGLDRACEAVARLKGAVQLVVAGAPDPTFDLDALRRRFDGRTWGVLKPATLSPQEYSDLVSASEAVLLPYRRITGSAALLAAVTLGRGAVCSDLPFFLEALAPEPDAGRIVVGDEDAALARALAGYLLISAGRREQAARRLAARHRWCDVVAPMAAALLDGSR